MSIPNLPTNFKDDILNTSVNQKRKYQQTYNNDGSVSFQDVTTYRQTGSEFGASQVNQTNKAVNDIYNERIVDLDELDLVTETGFFVDALAVKELNSNSIVDIRLASNLGYVKFNNGLAIQWGTINSPGSGAGLGVLTFPVSFLGSDAYSISFAPIYASPSYPVFDVSFQPLSGGAKGNVYFRQHDTAAIITGVTARWIAIGQWK